MAKLSSTDRTALIALAAVAAGAALMLLTAYLVYGKIPGLDQVLS
jgi:hypothetical protein